MKTVKFSFFAIAFTLLSLISYPTMASDTASKSSQADTKPRSFLLIFGTPADKAKFKNIGKLPVLS